MHFCIHTDPCASLGDLLQSTHLPRHASWEESGQKRQRSHGLIEYMLLRCSSTSYDKHGATVKNKIFVSDEKQCTKQQLVMSKHFAAIKTQLLWLTKMKRNNALGVVKEDLTTDGLYRKKRLLFKVFVLIVLFS